MKYRTITTLALSIPFLLINFSFVNAQSNGLGNLLNSTVKQIMQDGTTSTVQKSPTTSNASRTKTENKEIQSALNYFGYPVGTVDGSLGRRSRNAISDYQKSKGMQATGKLTGQQKSELLTSYRNSSSNNAAAAISALGIGQHIIGNRKDKPASAPQTVSTSPVSLGTASAPVSNTNSGTTPLVRSNTSNNAVSTQTRKDRKRSNNTRMTTSQPSIAPPTTATNRRLKRRDIKASTSKNTTPLTANTSGTSITRDRCRRGQAC